ncbi:glutamate-rich protein 1 isoform X2 [Pungitius pungitius]|uniref:glutamate-rich protein 1 isoform X2 n=1 Tax=Pungitius pungitius TaxID=134920 RepID=UPI002E0DA727
MARREEVFQSKVFQKLYPAPPKLEREPSPPAIVDALSRKTHVKRKAPQRETAAGGKPSSDNPAKRMYTVLPPPADYKTDSEKSVTLPQLESMNSADGPADGSVHDSNEEPGPDEEEEEPRRRRKRRKRKAALHRDPGAAGARESGPGPGRAPGDENMSRNKKRKLKKKRHKEKLLAMGLMPRAAALEFTYRKDEEEEEEEDNETRAFEVSDFLRTTMEIYMSDPSLRSDQRPLLCGTVNNLLSRRPPCALEQLHALKALVQRRQPGQLERALVELVGTSPLSSEETAAVASLFRYWITHILPMQGDEWAPSDAPATRGTLADRSRDVFQSAETDSGIHPAAADAGLPPCVCDPPS